VNGTIFLLCGLPASGKTTFAKSLEEKGALRLTLDA
jgi:predicted kinase